MYNYELAAHTETRYYQYTDKGAPVIKQTYGSLNNFLKVVLTEGYNEQTILSIKLDLSTGLAKVLLPLGHGFEQNQVIAIAGALEPCFNGVFRITSHRSDYITIEIPEEKVVTDAAASEITIKVAPLGYDIVYTNTSGSIMCFKNRSVKSPLVFKSIDEIPPLYPTNWSKFSRIAVGQSVDASGNFLLDNKSPYYDQYPNAELTGNGVGGTTGIYGYAKWVYATDRDPYQREHLVPEVGNRNWRLIGDGHTFYLFNSASLDGSKIGVVGVGNYVSRDPLDTKNIVLQAKDGFYSSQDTSHHMYDRVRNAFGGYENSLGCFIYSDIYGTVKKSNKYSCYGMFVSEYAYNRPWIGSVQNYNPVTGQLLTGDVLIKDNEGYFRGHHRGIKYLYGQTILSEGTTSAKGDVIMSVLDPFDYNHIMSFLFTLKNWEPIE